MTVVAHRLYRTARFSCMFVVRMSCCIVQLTWAISCGKLKLYPQISSQLKKSEESEMRMSGCKSENRHEFDIPVFKIWLKCRRKLWCVLKELSMFESCTAIQGVVKLNTCPASVQHSMKSARRRRSRKKISGSNSNKSPAWSCVMCFKYKRLMFSGTHASSSLA